MAQRKKPKWQAVVMGGNGQSRKEVKKVAELLVKFLNAPKRKVK